MATAIAPLHAQPAPSATEIPIAEIPAVDLEPVMVEPFRVSAERVLASDIEGPSALEQFDSQQIEDTGAFTVTEFFETLPSAGEEEVLVLIDGEPAYIDPSTLPLGMIAGIEVSLDGSMPQYGAYSTGRIINIRLKKDYQGAEIAAKFEGAFAGGGERESFRVSTSAVRGKFRALLAINASRRSELLATERDFSRSQDHTSWGGSDLRLPWGSPATVQAAGGFLNGLVDADGNPVTSALVPENQNGTSLTAGDFLPVAGDAAGQRRFDTAPYRQLVGPSDQLGATFSASYPVFGEYLRVSLSGSFSQSDSERLGAPPVTQTSSKSLVPAAYNPFGQDVQVGFVHTEFGPTRQESRSERAQLGLKFNGKISDSWSWDGGVAFRRDDSSQAATDLDPARLTAALASPDPALRFNPFGDPSASPVNAHLYPDLTFTRSNDSDRSSTRLDLSTDGTLVENRAGPMTLSLRGGYQSQERTRFSRGAPGTVNPESHYESQAHNLSSSVNVPLASRRHPFPFAYRLETRFSARYSTQDDGSEGTGGDAGFVWAPLRSVLFRARHSIQSSIASRDVSDRRENLVGETLLDPRRDLAATEAQIVVRDIADFDAEESTRQTLGFTLEPPIVKGLRFSGTYQNRARDNVIQRRFDPQDVVNNEAAFPGRVTRAVPTAEDVAAGRPGAIISVDTTPANSGRTEDSELDFSLEYSPPWRQFGRFRFSGNAEHALDSSHEISPGVAFINDGGGRSDSPDWEFRGTTSWSFKAWSASLRIDYKGEIEGGTLGEGIPAQKIVSLNTGWKFKLPAGPKRAIQYRLAVGIGNLFDEPPARADTLSGYRGGSPLGRTFTLTLSAAI